MTTAQIITIVVAVIAALSAYLSQRSSNRASTLNTETSTRIEMEREAYERARRFDMETIARQDAEILELRNDNRDLHVKLAEIKAETTEARSEVTRINAINERLRERILLLERELYPDPNHR